MNNVAKNIYQYIDFALWSRIHRLPRFFIEKWQFHELKRAVAEAYAHVPLYRKLMDERGMKPQDLRSFEDMRRLPITSKRLFRRYPIKAVTNRSFTENNFAWHQTSGSTGEPFRFPLIKKPRRPAGPAFCWFRFLAWRGLPLTKIEKLKIANIYVKIANIYDHLNKKSGMKYDELYISLADLRDHPADSLRRLQEFEPDIIMSKSAVLFELARHTRRLPQNKRPRPDYIISFGEHLNEPTREYIRSVLGGELYDIYGMEEAGNIAAECRAHDGFHIYEELFIIEIIDDEGKPIEPGGEGRLIVTRLASDPLPIIRYDSGDRGMIIKSPCPCGLAARRLKIIGRDGIAVSLGGKKFHLAEFEHILDGYDASILKYQFAKTGEGIELRVVPYSSFSAEDFAEVAKQFMEKFAFNPAIKIVGEIPLLQNGKSPVFVDESARIV